MKNSKRLMAWLLALVMIIGSFSGFGPIAAKAAEGYMPADGWIVMNENENITINNENSITINSERGDFAEDGSNIEPSNYWLCDAPEGDFVLTAKVSGGMSADYQKVGVMAYANWSNIASVVRRYHSVLTNTEGTSNHFGMFQYETWKTQGSKWGESVVADPDIKKDAYLKLEKAGNVFKGYYSYDGETWVSAGNDLTNDVVANAADMKIGVYAVSGSKSNEVEVTISDFTVNGEAVPFAKAGMAPAAKIELNKDSLSIEENTTFELEASVLPVYAGEKEVTWTTSDSTVATVKDGVVKAVAAGNATITAAVGDVKAVCEVEVYSAIVGTSVYLTDLQWTSASVGWPAGGSPSINISIDNTPISLDGVVYENGIVAHANSTITYNIDGLDVTHFLAYIGIQDGHSGNCNFIVKADNAIIFSQSDVTMDAETIRVRAEVPAGAKTLTLITDTNGTDNNDHSVWADACIISKPDSGDAPMEGGVQYLVSEPWYTSNLVSVGTGWGNLGVNTGVINPNTNEPDGGAYIKIGGKYYDYGFAAHAASQIVFDIENMGVTNFSAIAGIHNDRSGSSVGFIVMADKEVLYEIDRLEGSQTEEINVEVPADAKQLILITNDGGDGNTSDHSVWAMPAVTVDPASVSAVRRVTLHIPSFLTADDPEATATVTGELTNGFEADLSEAEIVYSTDNADVLDVDAATGALTLKGRGTANITVSVTIDGITRTAANMVTVDDGSGERAWEVASPDGNVVVSLEMKDDNALYYSATKGGKAIVHESTLGIDTDLADFTGGLLWKSSSVEEVESNYTLISGKASEVNNHYNELAITFVKGEAEMTVYMRAQADGFAYRYAVGKSDGTSGDLKVYSENGTFALPQGSELFMMDNADRFDHKFNHEGSYERVMLDELYNHLTAHEQSHSNVQQIYVSMPMLAESEDGLWTLITEANQYDDPYVGSYLKPISADNSALRVTIPDQQEYWTGHAEVYTAYPFETPWRLAITGDLGDVVESTMVTDVSDDPYLDMDFGWVEPGVTSWTWLSEGLNGQKEEEVVRKYVDLAYEMGWSYYIMDEGWQPKSTVAGKRYDGYYDWFDGMVTYAAERDVKLIAWILAHDLDTPEELAVLQEYAEKGIAGIKVDFFDIDDQDTIDLYKRIYDECAKWGLIVNCHGANKPTGEARTYPHVINREAVAGQEYGSVNAYQSTYWPFIRNVVGSMDITPRITPSGGSASRMAALFVMFESGMPCMASSAEEVLASNVVSLLKGLPSAWDEIHYIDGYPSEFATLARRSGDLWYAASINSNDKTRDAVFPLDFLKEGIEYCAVIYKDGASDRDVAVEYQIVTSEDTLTVPMRTIGGCTVKLLPLEEGKTVEKIELPEEIVLETGESLTIDYAVLPEEYAGAGIIWTVENPAVASMSKNTVTAQNVGATVIKATSEINPRVSATCVVRVSGVNFTAAQGWTVHQPSSSAADQGQLDAANPNKITLKTTGGDVDYNASAKNVWLYDAPEGDFELTVKLQGTMSTNYQKAGLIIWHDGANSVSAVRRYHTGLNNGTSSKNHFGMFSYLDAYMEPVKADEKPAEAAWLKLVKEGNVFTGYYSWDKETWVQTGTITNAAVGESDQLKFGVYACNTAGAVIVFEDITCNKINDGAAIPFGAVKVSKEVISVGTVEDVTVYGAADFAELPLPAELAVYFDNGDKVMAPVTWDASGYEPVTGIHALTGTVDISAVEGVIGDTALPVTANIIVVDGEEPVERLEIITQPVDTAVLNGEDAAITVEAVGEGLVYTWYYKNPGNKKFYLSGDQFVADGGAAYTIPMAAWRDGQEVYCVITDVNGESVQSNIVTLTMKEEEPTDAIEIVKQPLDAAVDSEGKMAIVSVTAKGEGLTYEWYYKNPGNVKFYKSGEQFVKENKYLIEVYKWRDGQQVYCVITDADGNSVQTNTVTICIK